MSLETANNTRAGGEDFLLKTNSIIENYEREPLRELPKPAGLRNPDLEANEAAAARGGARPGFAPALLPAPARAM
jgi:hypothetical protein